MPTAYRIVKTKYSRSAMKGEGASESGGRWNSTGRIVVYAAESRALAALEILVHLSPPRMLSYYSIAELTFPEKFILKLSNRDLPANWNRSPILNETQKRGDDWIESGDSSILEVPSAVIPQEKNFLLNPRHPDFSKIKVGKFLPFPFDSRLKK